MDMRTPEADHNRHEGRADHPIAQIHEEILRALFLEDGYITQSWQNEEKRCAKAMGQTMCPGVEMPTMLRHEGCCRSCFQEFRIAPEHAQYAYFMDRELKYSQGQDHIQKQA